MMQIGDVVKWTWHLSKGDLRTSVGLIINSKLRKTDYEKVIMFEVLVDGQMIPVREDEPSLELVA